MSANDVRTAERPIGTTDMDDAPGQLAPIVEQPRSAPRAQVVTPLTGREPRPERAAVVFSAEVDQLFAAMSEAQGEFLDLERTREVHIRSPRANYDFEHETLADVIRATKPALKAHGLAVWQFPDVVSNSTLVIRTYVTHKSGQWVYNDMRCAIDGVDPKAIASGVTYLCRYARKAILGLAAEWDDDAESASQSGSQPPQPSVRRSQQPPEPAASKAEPPAAAPSAGPPSPQGRVVKVMPKGDAWIVELETGFRAGTRDPKMAADLGALLDAPTVVRLTATTPSDPRYLGTIERAVEVK